MPGRVYAEDNKATVSLDVINRNGEKLSANISSSEA